MFFIYVQIVNNENAQKFVRIQIGDDSFSDLSKDLFRCGSAQGRKRRHADSEN